VAKRCSARRNESNCYVNENKSDHSPDSWKPPLPSFYCT
jgi:hypothetical protein